MPINDTTANRGYQKPNIANTLADDVGRLRSALDAIDTDMETALSPPISLNHQTISANFTIDSTRHGSSVGPVAIADGVTVTLDQSTWMIL